MDVRQYRAVLGIFWGAPLIARELETRTFTLACNQSITRTRWLVVKLALTGLAAMAVTEALSLMYAWWADPIGKATGLGASTSVFSGGRFSSLIFATHGITVVPGRPGAWILSSGAVNTAGQPVSNLPAACQAAIAGLKPSSPSLCMESRGLREAITYEPASRYWPLQGIETGIFGALALALAGFCFWRLGRRRT